MSLPEGESPAPIETAGSLRVTRQRFPHDVLLIRHGESEANAGTSDDCDCGLTALGREQSEKTGRLLRRHFDLSGTIAITSPYRRARETAELIAQGSALAFRADPRVREWGKDCVIDGTSYPEETLAKAAIRLDVFLRLLIPSQRYVIVSHATPIFLMMQLLTRGSVAAAIPHCTRDFWSAIKNCGVTQVREGKTVCVSKLLG